MMKLFPITYSIIFSTFIADPLLAKQNLSLPVLSSTQHRKIPTDWIIKPIPEKVAIYNSADRKEISILYNGLVAFSFSGPNVACVDFRNLSNVQQLLRAVKPEAIISIKGKVYTIGGLKGQKENAYLLPEWVDQFTTDENDFQFRRYEINPIEPFIKWKPSIWATNRKHPTGTMLSFIFRSTVPDVKDIVVKVNYPSRPKVITGL